MELFKSALSILRSKRLFWKKCIELLWNAFLASFKVKSRLPFNSTNSRSYFKSSSSAILCSVVVSSSKTDCQPDKPNFNNMLFSVINSPENQYSLCISNYLVLNICNRTRLNTNYDKSFSIFSYHTFLSQGLVHNFEM